MRECKNDSCSVVEMECALILAVGQFRGIEGISVLITAGCIDGNNWDKRILGNMPSSLRERILKIALETIIHI